MANLPLSIVLGGAVSPALREDLSANLNIVSDANAASSVVFDGSVAGPTLDQTLQTVKAGKTLIIANPTAAQLDQLAKISGAGVSPDVQSVSFRKLGRGYCLKADPAPPQVSRTAFRNTGKPATAIPAPPGPAGRPPSMGAQVADHARFTPPQAMDGTGGAVGLYPPSGAIFGVQSIVLTANFGLIPLPSGDPESSPNYQGADSQVINNFYVYYVNGLATPPYYMVILRQDTSAGVGTILTNDGTSCGYFQESAAVGVTNLASNLGSGGSLVLFDHNPNSNGASSASITETIDLSLPGPGGGNIGTPVMLTDEVDLNLPDWSFNDQTQAANDIPNWYFFQTTPFNPYTQEPGTTYFSGYGDDCAPVLTQPVISTSSLSATTYSVWTIANGSTLTGSITFYQHFIYAYIDTNDDGMGYYGGARCNYNLPFSLNLATITGQSS